MALQGTLDTFELPDVLRLLSTTKKSGRLRLQTDRGDGNVWVDEGLVVGVASPSNAEGEMSEGLFDLLRSREGSFVFQADEQAPSPGLPTDVEPLLIAAEERLAEWREIEKVVPSMYAHVRLADELPAPQVTIDADAWRTVTAIGSGVSVADLGRTLDLSEVGVCRLVRDLVELGLGTVSDDAPAVPTTPAASSWEPAATDRFTPIEFDDPDPAPAPAYEPEPPAAERTAPLSFDPGELIGGGGEAGYATNDSADDLAPVTPLRNRSDGPVFDDDLGSGADADMDDEEADEVARQLAKLSPRAAQAVAAAAAAETEAERNAALEALDDETDETVNRSLLLKFLGSPRA